MLQAVFENYSSNFIHYGSLMLLCGIFIVIYTLIKLRVSIPSNAPILIRENYPIIGATGFFTKRFDFLMSGKCQSQSRNFSFFIGKHPAIALLGEKGREAFFESKLLDLTEGYKVLFPVGPKVPDTVKRFSQTADVEAVTTEYGLQLNKRIIRMVHRDTLIRAMPKFHEDIKMSVHKLGKAGTFRPFDTIYKLVFQLTLRVVVSDDIADDPELLNDTLRYFEMIEASATIMGVIFPWLPTPTAARRAYAGAKIYMILKKIIDDRLATRKKKDDSLQYMLDMGDNIIQIIEYVIAALFAGIVSSGVTASYVLCYLASDPHWNAVVRKEIAEVTAKHSKDTSKPLSEQLGDIPISAWEKEFPMLDLCLKECIRMHISVTAFRRNISGRDVGIGKEVIPNGTFLVYHLSDTHMNPELFEIPNKWDPSRYFAERAEDQRLNGYAWNGWGKGRHVCLGMRFAKLEQYLITAYHLTAFDFQVVDSKGQPTVVPPPSNMNDPAALKPKDPVYLKYTART